MPAHDREYIGEAFRDFNRALAARQVGPDAIYLRNPCRAGAINHLRQISRKLFVVQMRVSVVKGSKHGEYPGTKIQSTKGRETNCGRETFRSLDNSTAECQINSGD
jgi:hypothetical protein